MKIPFSHAKRHGDDTARSIPLAASSLLVILSMATLSLLYLRPIWRWTEGALGGFPDVWMNIFQVWWMHRAFTEGLNPFFTPLLHHPTGAELYWHTLAPAKNGLGILLVPFMDPIAAYNVIVFVTFVLAGFTSWLFLRFLCREAVGISSWKCDLAAFAGAIVFNFSPYHLAHAWAHMNLIAIEGIPLFLLAYFLFKKTQLSRYAVLAAFASLLVILSDYYYFYYLALFLLFDVVYFCVKDHGRVFSLSGFTHPTVRAALKTLALMLVVTSPLTLALVFRYFTQEIHNFQHGDSDYYADLFGIFIPHRSSYWLPFFSDRIGSLVHALPGNTEENGYFLGWATLLLGSVAVWKRLPLARFFAIFAFAFALLSLGPWLSIAGVTHHRVWVLSVLAMAIILLFFRKKAWAFDLIILLSLIAVIDLVRPFTTSGRIVRIAIPLPYIAFKNIFPLYDMGGMPVRFILFTYLGLSVCVSLSAAWIARTMRSVAAIPFLCACIAIPAVEYWNEPFRMVPAAPRPEDVMSMIREEPPHIAVLTDDGGVLSQWEVTLHGHPVNAGSFSRISEEQHRVQSDIRHMIDAWVPAHAERKEEYLSFLKKHHFKYFLSRTSNEERHAFIVDVLGGRHLHSGRELHAYLLYE